MDKVYSFKSGAHIIKGVDAQTVGETLESITEKHGALTPKTVVDEARPTDAPLHPIFEWDDGIAGEAYRREQARHLIKAIAIRIEKPEGATELVRQYVSVRPPEPTAEDVSQKTYTALLSVAPQSDGYTFVPLKDALADPVLRVQVLADAIRELEAWQRKYAQYEELASIFAAADAVKRGLQTI